MGILLLETGGGRKCGVSFASFRFAFVAYQASPPSAAETLGRCLPAALREVMSDRPAEAPAEAFAAEASAEI